MSFHFLYCIIYAYACFYYGFPSAKPLRNKAKICKFHLYLIVYYKCCLFYIFCNIPCKYFTLLVILPHHLGSEIQWKDSKSQTVFLFASVVCQGQSGNDRLVLVWIVYLSLIYHKFNYVVDFLLVKVYTRAILVGDPPSSPVLTVYSVLYWGLGDDNQDHALSIVCLV